MGYIHLDWIYIYLNGQVYCAVNNVLRVNEFHENGRFHHRVKNVRLVKGFVGIC